MKYLLILYLAANPIQGAVNSVTYHEFPSEEACAKAAVKTSILVDGVMVKWDCVEIPSDDS